MKILQKIKTSDDLNTLKSELSSVSLELSGSKDTLLEKLIMSYAPVFGGGILEDLTLQNRYNKEEITIYLEELISTLSGYKVIELYVAKQLSPDAISHIFSWIVSNLNIPVVLKFHINPLLLGGAIVSFEGKYMDLSVLKKLDRALSPYK